MPKTIVHSFRTVVSDYGANHGFIISKSGFQKGAYGEPISEGYKTKHVHKIFDYPVNKLTSLRISRKLRTKKVGVTIYYNKVYVKRLLEEGYQIFFPKRSSEQIADPISFQIVAAILLFFDDDIYPPPASHRDLHSYLSTKSGKNNFA